MPKNNRISQVLWTFSMVLSKYFKKRKFPEWFKNLSLEELRTDNGFFASFNISPRETSAPIEGHYCVRILCSERKVMVPFSRKNAIRKLLEIKCEITGAASAIIKVAQTLDGEIKDSRAGLKQLRDLFKKISKIYLLLTVSG